MLNKIVNDCVAACNKVAALCLELARVGPANGDARTIMRRALLELEYAEACARCNGACRLVSR